VKGSSFPANVQDNLLFFIDHTIDAILIVSDSVIVYANNSVKALFGYTPSQILGKKTLRFISPASQELVEGRIAKRKAGETLSPIFDAEIICKDGRHIPTEISSCPIRYDGSDAAILVIRDISERRKSELMLLESEAKFKSVSDYMTETLVVTVGGKCVWTNRAFTELLGYEQKEALGKTIDNFALPEELPGIHARIKRRASGEELSRYYETILIHKTGRPINVETSITRIKFEEMDAELVIVRDITFRRQSELATKRRLLWDNTRLNLHDQLREIGKIDQCLKKGCEAIFKGQIFKRAVFTLHNEQRQITNIGYVGIDKKTADMAQKAPPPNAQVARKIMSKKYRLGNSYFIPAEAGFNFDSEARFVPQTGKTIGLKNAWRNGDELFVPILKTKKTIVGWLSVDTPFSKLRPDLEVVRYLEQIADIVYFKIKDIQNLYRIESESQQLKEKNIALREVLSHIEEEKLSQRQEVSSQVEKVILPAINKAIQKKGEARKSYIEIARTHLHDLITYSMGPAHIYSRLSMREAEICQLIAGGHSNKEIARILSISISTVQKHRESIRRKFGLKNKSENLAVFLQKLNYR